MKDLNFDCVDFGRQVMDIEAVSIRNAARRLGRTFEEAVTMLDAHPGKVITTGVGKSGIAAHKLAATLTSVGCPCVFLHPSEAMHGDLGIVATKDIVIALSNSGESEELLAILPALLSRNALLIAIVGNLDSTLARKASLVLEASIEREACPLNLAPTTSVVVALALGDALAMALQKRRGFREEDYALNHPGGRLGRRLTLRVRDVMLSGSDSLPVVSPGSLLMDVLCEITEKSVGATCVADAEGRLLGIITDHDVRRAFQRFGSESFAQVAATIMTPMPAVVLKPDQLAYEAMQLMEHRARPISVAPVVDVEGQCLGMVRIHDMVRAGL